MKTKMKVGIAGTGGIGFANAAWLAHAGHAVSVWSPGGLGAEGLRKAPLRASGVLETEVSVQVADSAQALVKGADVLLLAVPVNGHRAVMDRLLPHLRDGQTVIVSSMSSLSALYLAEGAKALGRDITVASFGTTVLTARRSAPDAVRIMTRRAELGVSALPQARTEAMVALCRELFGEGFSAQDNALASALTNINPAAHGPLALFNWTRIERAENWPQYHYMTPQVAAVIEKLDAERLALAQAFGLTVRTIERHFAQSFSTKSEKLSEIAAELHAARGGPPGPTDTATRFLAEDVPFGLVFCAALGRVAGLPMPATDTIVATASLITGRDFAAENDLIEPLKLRDETVAGLLKRVDL
ncbi:opine dehydrogenase [Polaromonas sp. OV174]|uniref:NAD/NADP octopine/nopaline dehydrogenase family protein n=1 Tax=Polaromonas sp. OV174 TaxID=1855300 RepID=UPI0008E15653|nr:NAD/NADP octopine/nopaline dehydrogenase family protein [Polaromonas sp. OV174]SFB84201.1 opine dehydrogenase [Polaromonas sp. OV174]